MKETIKKILNSQREFFKTGKTLDISFRKEQLAKLRDAIKRHENEMIAALAQDLGRSEAEAYFCDIGSVVAEINETLRGINKWSKPELHFSGFLCFPSLITRVYKKPYGCVLIISPFNFPFMLSLGVLAAAIAGGNTALIRPSSKSPACSSLLQKIIAETYDASYVSVITGGHDVADLCLEQRFDKIFYTGSPRVAKHVMECAAKNLTPVAFELGGENGNWAIVRKDADIKDAVRKISFFKVLNSGQICINVNQVAVAEEIAGEFIEELRKKFVSYPENPLENADYAHLIDRNAYEKCVRDCERYRDRIVCGGIGDENNLRFMPTVIYPVAEDEEIVQRELFSPILPVITYKDGEIEKILETIESRERGLALYVFTNDGAWAEKTMKKMNFGGGCINEVCLHIMVKGVPFNGTGHSGTGAYHGEWGFREFTYPCTVLKGSRRFNLSLREHPYTEKKLRMIRFFEK
ncbi:MAG: aldehyde dehydrogenase family protein [Clostridia bacterium]|nr:aldehyde dehydrogenase family protein [Clostridia bacterium]